VLNIPILKTGVLKLAFLYFFDIFVFPLLLAYPVDSVVFFPWEQDLQLLLALIEHVWVTLCAGRWCWRTWRATWSCTPASGDVCCSTTTTTAQGPTGSRNRSTTSILWHLNWAKWKTKNKGKQRQRADEKDVFSIGMRWLVLYLNAWNMSRWTGTAQSRLKQSKQCSTSSFIRASRLYFYLHT